MLVEFVIKHIIPVLFGLLGIFVIIIVTFWTANIANVRRPGFRNLQIDNLRKEDSFYRLYLDSALDFCNRFWGPVSSFRALGVSMIISLFYLISLFLLCWVAMGPGKIGETILLTEDWDQIQRVLFLCTVALSSVGVFVFMNFAIPIESYCMEKLRRLFSRYYDRSFVDDNGEPTTWAAATSKKIYYAAGCVAVFLMFLGPPYIFYGGLAGYQVFLILGLALPFVVTILAGYSFQGVVAILFSISFVGLFSAYPNLMTNGSVPAAIAIMSTVGFASAFALGTLRGDTAEDRHSYARVAVGVTGSLGGFFVGYIAGAAGDFGKLFADSSIMAVLLFLVMLPAVNGVFDWTSLTISRLLGYALRSVMRRPRISRLSYVVHIVLFAVGDFVIAAFLLVAITYSLGWIIESINSSALDAGYGPPLELAGFMNGVTDSPIGPNGLWVTFMLFSTLIPTFAHLLAVLFASIATIRPSAHAVNQLEVDLLSDREEIRERGQRALAYCVTLRDSSRWCGGIFVFLVFGLTMLGMIQMVAESTIAENLRWVAELALARAE